MFEDHLMGFKYVDVLFAVSFVHDSELKLTDDFGDSPRSTHSFHQTWHTSCWSLRSTCVGFGTARNPDGHWISLVLSWTYCTGIMPYASSWILRIWTKKTNFVSSARPIPDRPWSNLGWVDMRVCVYIYIYIYVHIDVYFVYICIYTYRCMFYNHIQCIFSPQGSSLPKWLVIGI